MSAPTPPTSTTLVTEGLNIAGYANPATGLVTRANAWLEDIKNDVWTIQRKLKSLQTSAVQPLTNGLPQYSNPSDYASDLELTYVTGSRYGTAQAGSTTTVTLAAADGSSADSMVGREIFIYSGTGSGQRAYVTGFDPTTKVATVSPAFTVAPDNTSLYLLADTYKPLARKLVWVLGEKTDQTVRGEPCEFYPMGDSQYGKYILNPVPYHNDSQPMVLLQRYYANLMTLDLAGTLMSTLYQNWRNVWLTGIKARAWEDMDDNRWVAGKQEYGLALRKMVGAESYGADGPLQQRVKDY